MATDGQMDLGHKVSHREILSPGEGRGAWACRGWCRAARRPGAEWDFLHSHLTSGPENPFLRAGMQSSVRQERESEEQAASGLAHTSSCSFPASRAGLCLMRPHTSQFSKALRDLAAHRELHVTILLSAGHLRLEVPHV